MCGEINLFNAGNRYGYNYIDLEHDCAAEIDGASFYRGGVGLIWELH